MSTAPSRTRSWTPEIGSASSLCFLDATESPQACGPTKDSGTFRCTPGFADEAIDIDLPLAGIRIMQKSIIREKGLDFNAATGPQASGDSVVSKKHRELAEAISGVQDRVRLGAVLTT